MMIECGLKDVLIVVGNRCTGLADTVNAMLPDACYQWCMVHFMRNVLSRINHKHMAWATVTSCLREGVGEAATYLLDDSPVEYRRRIRVNNMIERLNREIRRRTRVVGGFPDGRSTLMLICVRILRHRQ